MSETTPKACVSPKLYQDLLERPLWVKWGESVEGKMLTQTTLKGRRSGLGPRPNQLPSRIRWGRPLVSAPCNAIAKTPKHTYAQTPISSEPK
eukprot:1261728-Pleurochrysis_carterae.AAC.1